MSKITASQRQELCDLFTSGTKPQVLAAAYGVSGARVYKILQEMGIDSMRGRPRLSFEERVWTRWGITLSEYEAHVSQHGDAKQSSSPLRKYLNQKKSAASRGLNWGFSFTTWWDVWMKSGKWAERGAGNGYVMARYNDGDTPYSPSTVYICTSSQNTKDSYVNYPLAMRAEGLCSSGAGKGYTIRTGKNPYRAQFRKIDLGCYPTAELARAAYLAAAAEYNRSQA